MKYDFETPVNRRNEYALKWSGPETELPMWVADMDFRTAPEITEGLLETVREGIFGYTGIPRIWYQAYRDWWHQEHGLSVSEDCFVFVSGVVPALSSIVRRITLPNEKVCIMPPVYGIFWNSVENQGRRVLECPLVYHRETLSYSMDPQKLEECLRDPQCTMLILCNPHNPTGQIWSREDLKTVADLAEKHGVTVVSDEIHCDITLPGRAYTPFAGVSESARRNSITCMSASKAFNLAGLHSAAVMIPNPHLRQRISRGLNNEELAESSTLGARSAVLALTRGRDWLLALRETLQKNRMLASRFIREEIPGILPVPAEATYLLWADIGNITADDQKFAAFLRTETGLRISPGSGFGNAGRGFIRINLACPETTLMDGLARLRDGTERFAQKMKSREP
ncbi:MalY/PatB family protein [Succinimonas amylolytica]|uniref:MalY/PatB family protein n=1 Tax=Succinimonas amylolytica TaxID=83769 RepID=UPI000373E135|nr:MalY/PatB family protein [Succinimonas amylolytica]